MQRELREEPFEVEEVLGASLWRIFQILYVYLALDLRVNPEHTGKNYISHLILEHLDIFREELENFAGDRDVRTT